MPTNPEWHRSLAAETFNRTWQLLESDPGPERDRDLLTSALTSRYHWQVVGTPRNRAISDWMVSRVFSTLGDPDQASAWATSALILAAEHDLGPFLEGSAHEALARAAALAGDRLGRERHLGEARRLLALVTDEEEREVLGADIAAAAGHPVTGDGGTSATS